MNVVYVCEMCGGGVGATAAAFQHIEYEMINVVDKCCTEFLSCSRQVAIVAYDNNYFFGVH